MKIGDKIKFKAFCEYTWQKTEVDDTVWEIVGFEEKDTFEFVKVVHPNVGGVFSFYKEDVAEVLNG